MFDRNYYVICDDGCKFTSMTKEQILAAIAEATGATVTDIDAAFISKIKNQNGGGIIKLWRGTNAEYNALTDIDADCHYIITDDTSKAAVNEQLETLGATVEAVEKKIDEQATTVKETAETVAEHTTTLEEHTIALNELMSEYGEADAKISGDGNKKASFKYKRRGDVYYLKGTIDIELESATSGHESRTITLTDAQEVLQFPETDATFTAFAECVTTDDNVSFVPCAIDITNTEDKKAYLRIQLPQNTTAYYVYVAITYIA